VPPVAAEARLRRLLSIIPWVAEADGPTVADVCARFDCTEAELLADLDLLFMCGLYPYTPDMLIEVDISEGRVWIKFAEYFRRPLRLTPTEALALVAAGQTLLGEPSADEDGPLARGLRKLAGALGLAGDGAVEVELGPAPASVLEVLREGVDRRLQVELEYYSFGRDAWTTRVIEPWAVFSSGGQWYVTGFSVTSASERLFRVDRIQQARLLDAHFDPPEQAPNLDVYRPRPEDPRVTFDLLPAARWVVEQYPVEHIEELGGGRVRARLAVSERAWLERLLLRLGPDADVVDGDASPGRDAARRLLQRYNR
jgi:proteasome accessory factor C